MKHKITKEKLNKLYWKEGKTLRQIAEFFNCGHETIRKNLKEYSIPIRTKSEAMEGFKHSKETKIRLSQQDFWELNNGITLCKTCHKKTDSYLNNKLEE